MFSFKPSRSEERTDEGENRCSATRDLPAVPTGVRVITHVASLPRLVTGEHQHSDLEVRSLKCSASTVGLPSGALKALNKDAENGKKKSRSQTPPDLCCIKATTVLVQQLLQVFQTPLGCEVKPRLTSPPNTMISEAEVIKHNLPPQLSFIDHTVQLYSRLSWKPMQMRA